MGAFTPRAFTPRAARPPSRRSPSFRRSSLSGWACSSCLRSATRASWLAAAGAWLLDPAEPAPVETLTAPAALRPVVAVFGLARSYGATVVARALAAELARRDALGAAAVH